MILRLLPERALIRASLWDHEGFPANFAADELARRWGG